MCTRSRGIHVFLERMKIRFSGSPVTCITEMVVENRFRNGLAYTLLKSTRRRPETLQMS